MDKHTKGTANWFQNLISNVGQKLNAPVIFDWDTDAAREDALFGATRTKNDATATDYKRGSGEAYDNVAKSLRTPVGGSSLLDHAGRYLNPLDDPNNPANRERVDNRLIGGDGNVAYDPYAALRAQQAGEAQQIKDRLLGRGKEVDTILAEILGNIDSLVKDQKRVRDQQYGVDTRSLVDALGSSIPEIEKAFASLGLSNSTFVGDRRDDTSRQYQLSQESVDRQLASDLAEYGRQANSWRGQAQASADKAKNNLDYVRNSEATADNLNTFKEKESQFKNMLTDFGAQRSNFTTSGDALKDLQKVGSDYDFSKIMDSFGSMAASSANTGVGGTAPQAVLDGIRGIDPKKKNNKTEVDINNPVGAATV